MITEQIGLLSLLLPSLLHQSYLIVMVMIDTVSKCQAAEQVFEITQCPAGRQVFEITQCPAGRQVFEITQCLAGGQVFAITPFPAVETFTNFIS